MYHGDNHIRKIIGKSIELWYFDTNDDWPAGDYTIDVIATDLVTAQSTTQTIFFTLV